MKKRQQIVPHSGAPGKSWIVWIISIVLPQLIITISTFILIKNVFDNFNKQKQEKIITQLSEQTRLLMELQTREEIDSFEKISYLLKDGQPQVYLNLMAIIQGGIFGYLATMVIENYQQFNIIAWINIFTSLQVIILIWIAYASGMLVGRRMSVLLDNIHPFVYAILQLLVIVSMQNSAVFFLAITGINFFSLLARIHQFYEIEQNKDDNIYLWNKLNNNPIKRNTYLISILYTLLFFTLYLLYVRIGSIENIAIILSVLAAFSSILYFFLLDAANRELLSDRKRSQ